MFNWNKIIFGCAALMLVLGACSNEDASAVAPVSAQKSEPGENTAKVGPVEDLNNAHVEGQAAILSRMDLGHKDVYLYYELASKVRMYELDSATLDTTGVVWRNFVLDTNGNFSFDGVSLQSPYVMIETEPVKTLDGMILRVSPRVIVDVRKTNNVSVNMLTYLESFRLRHLVQSGMSFDAAKAQAMREVLDVFGLYDEPLDFDKKDNAHVQEYLDFTGWFFINVFVDSVTASFSQSGQFGNLDSWAQDSFIIWAATDVDWSVNGYVDYATNFLSALHGFGKCSAAFKDSSFEVNEGYYQIKCDGNQWKATLRGFKQVEYTTGTMTDSRNGKTYKTVTYNIDNSPQTWMAENLDYGDSEHKEWCFEIKPGDRNLNSVLFENVQPADSLGCGTYGGLYRAYDALMLDTTLLVENALDSCLSNRRRFENEVDSVVIDTLKVRESCYYTYLDEAKISQWADSVESANGHIQGICPDGWHIPTSGEWKVLWTHLENVIKGDSLLGDPSGFGLKPIVQTSYESGFVKTKDDIYFAMKPGPIAEYNNELWSWTRQPSSPYVGYGIGILTSFVRCVKN